MRIILLFDKSKSGVIHLRKATGLFVGSRVAEDSVGIPRKTSPMGGMLTPVFYLEAGVLLLCDAKRMKVLALLLIEIPNT